MHEVSHSLQNELDLQFVQAVPASIVRSVRGTGAPVSVARVWARWNREIFGDMLGCLLGGEAFVASLLDVIGRSTSQALNYNPTGVHPTPYLRTFLSTELLRRMGFPDAARAYESAWRTLYPTPTQGTLPKPLLRTAPDCIGAVVDAVCDETPVCLAGERITGREVITFEPRHQLDDRGGRGPAGKGCRSRRRA